MQYKFKLKEAFKKRIKPVFIWMKDALKKHWWPILMILALLIVASALILYSCDRIISDQTLRITLFIYLLAIGSAIFMIGGLISAIKAIEKKRQVIYTLILVVFFLALPIWINSNINPIGKQDFICKSDFTQAIFTGITVLLAINIAILAIPGRQKTQLSEINKLADLALLISFAFGIVSAVYMFKWFITKEIGTLITATTFFSIQFAYTILPSFNLVLVRIINNRNKETKKDKDATSS